MSKKDGDLKLDPRNARNHSDMNKARIKKSLEAVGAGRGILADAENIIRAGNGIYEQAKALGFKFKVVDVDDKTILVSRRPDLRGKRAVRAAMLDNLASDSSAYDYDAKIFANVVNNDALLKAIAEDDEKLLALLGTDEDLKENDDEHAAELVDKAKELQKKWKVRPGDIWQIGEHFIICGDCTNFDDWKKLLTAAGIEKVNGVFTSPPYAEQRKKQYGGIPTEKYVDWWYDVQANVRTHLAEDGSFFVNIKPHCENGERVLYVFDLVLAMRRKWEWKFVDELSWIHQGMPGKFGRRLKNRFEPVYHFSINEAKTKFENIKYESEKVPTGSIGSNASMQGIGDPLRDRILGKATPGNILEIGIGNPNEYTGHPGQFPVALPEFFIKAYSDVGDIWLDPFLGSGTTICAAHRNGRRGIGIEKLEKYMAVCLERIYDLTEIKPKCL